MLQFYAVSGDKWTMDSPHIIAPPRCDFSRNRARSNIQSITVSFPVDRTAHSRNAVRSEHARYMQDWTPNLATSDKPRYLAIADAIADDIRSGRLAASDRLP